MLAQGNDYLEEAYNKLNTISADEQKRLEYDAREKALRDHEWMMKTSRERGYKIGFQDGFQDGETAGFTKGEKAGFTKGEIHAKTSTVMELLKPLGSITEKLEKKIVSESNPDILNKWIRFAAKAESIVQFEKMIEEE